MTREEVDKALQWSLVRCGLDHWNIELQYTDNRPPWVRVNEDLDGGGRSKTNADKRESRIWVSQAGCKAAGNDVLMVLFHEVRHISLEAVGITDDNDLVEFDLDRMAETMVFAYLNGLKENRK